MSERITLLPLAALAVPAWTRGWTLKWFFRAQRAQGRQSLGAGGGGSRRAAGAGPRRGLSPGPGLLHNLPHTPPEQRLGVCPTQGTAQVVL